MVVTYTFSRQREVNPQKGNAMAAEPTKDIANANVIQELQIRLTNLNQWKERDITDEERQELADLLAEIKLKVMAFQFGHGIF